MRRPTRCLGKARINVEYTEFGNTGVWVSKLGLGGAPLAGDFGRTDEQEVQHMIHAALDLGITFIDTAPLYGNGESERRIGKALSEGKRGGVFLASKAVRSDRRYTYKAVIQSVEDSLIRLRTDWIDLLQMHDVETQPYELLIEETIPALERLREDGKIRYIGATTRYLQVLERLMSTERIDAVQFYGRYMLLDFTAAETTIPLAKSLGLGVVNSSVLGMGLLAGRPASFLQNEVVKEAEERIRELDFLLPEGARMLAEPAMRFSLGHPDIHVTLIGASSVKTLAANAAICDGRGLQPYLLARLLKQFAGHTFFP